MQATGLRPSCLSCKLQQAAAVCGAHRPNLSAACQQTCTVESECVAGGQAAVLWAWELSPALGYVEEGKGKLLD